MKKTVVTAGLVTMVSLGLGMAYAVDAGFADAPVEISSLRGHHPIDRDADRPNPKRWQDDQAPIERDYVSQPPLVPHSIEGYRINRKFNKCLTCHSWKNYRSAGATKISQTHFEDRDRNVHANIAARRYFCTQCHVPQVDAPPLVENTFEPVEYIR